MRPLRYLHYLGSSAFHRRERSMAKEREAAQTYALQRPLLTYVAKEAVPSSMAAALEMGCYQGGHMRRDPCKLVR